MGLTWDLGALLTAAGIPAPGGLETITVTGVTCDSRRVVAGELFVAVRGASQDGSAFIPEAIRQGACAVVADAEATVATASVPIIRVSDMRRAIAALAHAWHDDPSRDLVVVGITGTNGKTTVTYLIQTLLQQAGRPCGLIGTIEYRAGGQPSPSHNTTPGPVELAALCAQMRQAGLQACAMEVSSHALDQRRVEGMAFQIGVFLNATPEHLDYHKTFEAYLAAKASLFAMLPPWGTAVVNAEDPSASVIKGQTMARILTFGVGVPADVAIQETRCTLEGSDGLLVTPAGRTPFHTTLIGRHNLSNVAAMAAVGTACGLSVATMASAISAFQGVPGRLERIEAGQSFPVFVDYAHTDDALSHVLGALRVLTDHRLIVVFGCGGDRDRAKRPRMGAVAGQYADRIIVTSDNPRSEAPQAIADEVVAGIPPTASCAVVLDRAAAIRQALTEADARSVVLIAGKGHETTQIFHDGSVPFDDRQVVREALAECAGVRA